MIEHNLNHELEQTLYPLNCSCHNVFIKEKETKILSLYIRIWKYIELPLFGSENVR